LICIVGRRHLKLRIFLFVRQWQHHHDAVRNEGMEPHLTTEEAGTKT